MVDVAVVVIGVGRELGGRGCIMLAEIVVVVPGNVVGEAVVVTGVGRELGGRGCIIQLTHAEQVRP